MRIATEVKGYITAPAPADIVYAPIDLAIKICDGLTERGHKVDFYGPEGSHLKKAKVVSLGLTPLIKNYREYHDALLNTDLHSDNVFATWDQYLAAEMFRRAAQGDYDLLHFHHPEVALPFVNIYPSVQVVYTMHDPITPLQRQILTMHQTPNQHLISISDKQRGAASDLPYAATVYNGVDTELFKPNESERGKDLLFLGSILPHKGTKEAIEVAQRANSGLVIVGPTYPNHLHYFNQYVKPYLNDKIRYIGPVAHAQTAAYFKRAKALLMPIQWEEPFGLTMIEAMACGTPVIAMKRGSVPEIVHDGVTGFVVDSLPGMVKAVNRLNLISPRACRRQVLTRFSLTKMVEGYERVFSSLVHALAINKAHFLEAGDRVSFNKC